MPELLHPTFASLDVTIHSPKMQLLLKNKLGKLDVRPCLGTVHKANGNIAYNFNLISVPFKTV